MSREWEMAEESYTMYFGEKWKNQSWWKGFSEYLGHHFIKPSIVLTTAEPFLAEGMRSLCIGGDHGPS